jgi:hypothetical protein
VVVDAIAEAVPAERLHGTCHWCAARLPDATAVVCLAADDLAASRPARAQAPHGRPVRRPHGQPPGRTRACRGGGRAWRCCVGTIATVGYDQTPFLVGRLSVTRGDGLEGLALWELSGTARVIARHRADGHLEHALRRDTTFAAGDEAYLVGRPDEVMQVPRRDAPVQPVVGIEMP